MKILFATHEGVPLYRGGPWVKIRQSRVELQKLGVDVQLLNPWTAAEQLADCDLVHLYGASFATYNLARNLLYQKKPFVVNPVFYSRRTAGVIRAVCRVDSLTRGRIPGLWWEWGFTRDICNWAEAVLPNTHAEQELLRLGMGIPQEKFSIIPNGVSGHFRQGDATLFTEKYGLRDFILYVGHIGPERKNALNMLRALEELALPGVLIARLMNTGEAAGAERIIRRCPHLLHIPGLANDDPLLASAYAACKVFILPSQFETPGRAALEAALAGANIIITPHGGTREYFGGMADYVEPGDVEALKQSIRLALQKEAPADLPGHIEQHFSWPVIARKTLQLYQRVLAGGVSRGS